MVYSTYTRSAPVLKDLILASSWRLIYIHLTGEICSILILCTPTEVDDSIHIVNYIMSWGQYLRESCVHVNIIFNEAKIKKLKLGKKN
jgi:hypothetical protein